MYTEIVRSTIRIPTDLLQLKSPANSVAVGHFSNALIACHLELFNHQNLNVLYRKGKGGNQTIINGYLRTSLSNYVSKLQMHSSISQYEVSQMISSPKFPFDHLSAGLRQPESLCPYTSTSRRATSLGTYHFLHPLLEEDKSKMYLARLMSEYTQNLILVRSGPASGSTLVFMGKRRRRRMAKDRDRDMGVSASRPNKVLLRGRLIPCSI